MSRGIKLFIKADNYIKYEIRFDKIFLYINCAAFIINIILMWYNLLTSNGQYRP